LTDQTPLPDIADLETKTQNISHTATDATKTTMVEDLDISSVPTGLTVDGVVGQGEDVALNGSAGILNDGRYGYTFTLNNDIVVSRVKVRTGARNGNSGGFIGYWYRDPPSTTWILGVAVSLSIGSVGSSGGFRWSENGYPRGLSANTIEFNSIKRIHAFVLDMGINGLISAEPPSSLTYGPGVNIIGRCYEAEPNSGTFPTIQTREDYAPVCSFEYTDNSPSFNKKLSCGLIDNKNGTIINVSEPTNLQDVSTKLMLMFLYLLYHLQMYRNLKQKHKTFQIQQRQVILKAQETNKFY